MCEGEIADRAGELSETKVPEPDADPEPCENELVRDKGKAEGEKGYEGEGGEEREEAADETDGTEGVDEAERPRGDNALA